MTKATNRKVTAAQIDVLCTFFEENPEIITGYKKTPECINAVQEKWEKITPHLNSLGVHKNQKAWAKYLCDLKAKLKRKRIKWKQNQDGSGPIICDANDFSEIGLRMLLILRKNINNTQDSQRACTSNTESIIKEEHINDYGLVTELKDLKKSIDSRSSPVNETPQNAQVFNSSNHDGDEFDMFGKNMARQLRALPLAIALETQEMLLSIMCKQRLKVLKNVEDPLDKEIS